MDSDHTKLLELYVNEQNTRIVLAMILDYKDIATDIYSLINKDENGKFTVKSNNIIYNKIKHSNNNLAISIYNLIYQKIANYDNNYQEDLKYFVRYYKLKYLKIDTLEEQTNEQFVTHEQLMDILEAKFERWNNKDENVNK